MPLYDAYGREIKKNKPILDEIGGVSGIRDRYSTYPSHGLTPERLTAIFKEADTGELLRQSELFEEMEEKDAHLSAVLQTRKLSVAGLEWEVVAASEEKEDERIAEFVREALAWIGNWDDALLSILDAVGKGFSVSEIMWEIDGGKVWCRDILWRHQKKFTFYSKDAMLDEPRLLTNEQPFHGEELLPNKFIYHRAGGRTGSVPRMGVLRACAWMYLFKNYTLKDWVVFNERFAMPMRVGKYRPGATPEEKKVLRNAVFNLGSDAAAVISEDTMIELLEQTGKTGTAAIYEKLADRCDKAISKAVLGHTGSADSTPGKLGSEDQAKDVRQDILEADARALAKTIRMQLIQPLVLFNFGPDTSLPTFRFNHEEGEDLEASATTYKTLGEAGLKIPASHVYQKFGIPEPGKDEEVLERPSSALPFKESGCACGCGRKPHGRSRRVAMSARDDSPDWADEYLSRLAPSLKGVRTEALKKIEEYLASQSTPPSLEEFDAAVQARLGEAYAGIDRAAIDDVVTEMYTWHKLTDTLGPSLETAFGGADMRAVQFLSRQDGFYHSRWTRNPEVRDAVTDFLGEQYLQEGAGLFGRADPARVRELKDLLAQKMVSLEGYQVDRIIDTSVQRTRNWAHTRQLADAGVVEIEILEPTMDCEFCAMMHGKIIRVEDADARVQSLAAMSPEEYEAALKAKRPTLDNINLYVSGAELPPYHPHCHGRIRKRIVQ